MSCRSGSSGENDSMTTPRNGRRTTPCWINSSTTGVHPAAEIYRPSFVNPAMVPSMLTSVATSGSHPCQTARRLEAGFSDMTSNNVPACGATVETVAGGSWSLGSLSRRMVRSAWRSEATNDAVAQRPSPTATGIGHWQAAWSTYRGTSSRFWSSTTIPTPLGTKRSTRKTIR